MNKLGWDTGHCGYCGTRFENMEKGHTAKCKKMYENYIKARDADPAYQLKRIADALKKK